jgi:hypothetical protein
MQLRSSLAIGLSFLVGIVTVLLTLTPISAPSLGPFAHSDKFYHALAFAGLALPMVLFRSDWLIVTVPLYATFGALIELIQPFVGRERSVADWNADLLGIGIGIIVGLALRAVMRIVGRFRLQTTRARIKFNP